jgi:hypothetical protein
VSTAAQVIRMAGGCVVCVKDRRTQPCSRDRCHRASSDSHSQRTTHTHTRTHAHTHTPRCRLPA